ncbi:MAG: DUF6351 family protein [Acidimicrobiia bacterium]
MVLLVAAACSASDDSAGDADAGERASAPVDEGVRTRATSADGSLAIETTSTRAAYVSNGDVLVTLLGDGAAEAVVTLDGTDVSDGFRADGDVRRGLVTGLVDGENTLQASAGGETVTLTVTSHPKNGPLFSGPHLEPWVCTTEAEGLGAPTDADCDAPTVTTWSYRTSAGAVAPLADPAVTPADVATTTMGGATVPFVIRTERGVIDRGIFTIWTLDPTRGTAGRWDDSAWNGRLVFRFGGGCGTEYSQGSSRTGNADLDLLGRGYAVVTNTLDTFQTACNPTLSAEAALMTREHFVETYGVPDFTIGDGASGGAAQQFAIAHNYPGILDAVSAALPVPDVVSIQRGATDCGLLLHYYGTESGTALTAEQKQTINGHASAGTCPEWNRLVGGIVNPTDGCDAIGDQVYNRVTNPEGARCTLHDINVNVFGIDPETGFARRPFDNVGIQYGLDAMNSGVISVDRFLDLNEHIGGYGIDGDFVAARSEVSEETATLAYRVGAVIGLGPVLDVPIILRSPYTDDIGDVHTRVHAFSIRDRLRDGGTDDPNLLLWTSPLTDPEVLLGDDADANEAIVLLDDWLTNGDKPATATNRCVLPDGQVLHGGWELYDDPGPCADAFRIYGDPRIAAGEARRADAIRCALAPVDVDGYEVEFTPEQAARLEAIFAEGVCDWDAPGIGMGEPDGTWHDFGDRRTRRSQPRSELP